MWNDLIYCVLIGRDRDREQNTKIRCFFNQFIFTYLVLINIISQKFYITDWEVIITITFGLNLSIRFFIVHVVRLQNLPHSKSKKWINILERRNTQTHSVLVHMPSHQLLPPPPSSQPIKIRNVDQPVFKPTAHINNSYWMHKTDFFACGNHLTEENFEKYQSTLSVFLFFSTKIRTKGSSLPILSLYLEGMWKSRKRNPKNPRQMKIVCAINKQTG